MAEAAATATSYLGKLREKILYDSRLERSGERKQKNKQYKEERLK